MATTSRPPGTTSVPVVARVKLERHLRFDWISFRASSVTDGKGAARRFCSMCSGWDRRPIRSPQTATRAWTETYRWKKLYGIQFLYAGPLFIHQLSHVWLDFRGIQDEYMREKGIDYFENSRCATYVQ